MPDGSPTAGFDLDERRAERARMRAAKRAGKGETLPLRFGDHTVLLGAEFPLDVLAPFAEMDVDMALVLRQAIEIATAQDAKGQLDDVSFLVNVLAQNPNLPNQLINAVRTASENLLGKDGYSALVAKRPTPWDIGDLAKCLADWYGVGFPESRRPSTPSADGGISKPISTIGTPDSTSPDAGAVPATPVSSG